VLGSGRAFELAEAAVNVFGREEAEVADGGLDHVMTRGVERIGAGDERVGRAEDADAGRAERGGELEGAAIVGDDPRGSAQERGQRDEAGVAGEIEEAIGGRRLLAIDVGVAGPDDFATGAVARDGVGEGFVSVPALLRAASAGEHHDGPRAGAAGSEAEIEVVGLAEDKGAAGELGRDIKQRAKLK
jgi:hypothetical protein